MQRLHIMELYHDSGPGGAEQMIINLSRGLAEAGHRVTVGLFCQGWLYEGLRRCGIETVLMTKKGTIDLRALGELARFIQRNGIDLIHAHELGSSSGGSMVSWWTGRPIVATIHGREYLTTKYRRKLACRWVGKISRRVIAVSKTLEHFLVDQVGIPFHRIQTIYNGIEVERYQQNGTTLRLRQDLGIGPKATVIGTVGSLYPVKGHIYLLQAMAKIKEKIPSVICLLIGHGQMRAALERQAADLGLEDCVRFLGFRQDVPELLGVMDIFVLPSLSEGLPLSLLEAMSAGKPVVATNVGGNHEVVEDGVTGYLVPPGRSDLLTERILKLLADPKGAWAMGAKANLTIQNRFSRESMVRQYERLFEMVLS